MSYEDLKGLYKDCEDWGDCWNIILRALPDTEVDMPVMITPDDVNEEESWASREVDREKKKVSLRDIYNDRMHDLVKQYYYGKNLYNKLSIASEDFVDDEDYTINEMETKAHNKEKNRINKKLKRVIKATDRLKAEVERDALPDAPRFTTATKKHIKEFLAQIKEDHFEEKFGATFDLLIKKI